jgi:hypothetical protein
MTLREYRPINMTIKIPKTQLQLTELEFNKLWKIMQPEPHHCLLLGDYTLVKSDKVQSKSIISVKNPDNQEKQKIIKEYPTYLQSKISDLNKQLNLSKTHLNKLKDKIEAEEVKQLEIAQQVELMAEEAHVLREETDRKNFIRKIRNRYSKLNECLDEGLKDLELEVKDEVSVLLSDLVCRINEVSIYLKEN